MKCTSMPGVEERGAATPLRRLGSGGIAVVLAASLYGCSAAEDPSGPETAARELASTSTPEDRGAPKDDDAPGGEAAGGEAAGGERGPEGAPGDKAGAVRVFAPAEPGQPAVVEDNGTGEEKRSTTPPVPLGEAAQPDEALRITVESTQPVEAQGMGPGGMAGPAIAVVVAVTNTSDELVSTMGSTVTLTYGAEDLPAPPTRQPGESGLPVEIPPGATVTGTYTFLVPEDRREDIVITASYRATDPAAVFTGPALRRGADR